MTDGGTEALDREQLDRLASYFDEEVMSAKTTKSLELRFSALLPDDAHNVRWESRSQPLIHNT
jgi:hypothetical protein